MNLLTRLFALHFDRSFSGKGWRQLAWLFGVIVTVFLLTLNPQLHSRSATYIKRNGLLIRKITIKSSRPFQCAYHPLTP